MSTREYTPGRFFIYKDGTFKGAEHLTSDQQEKLEEEGYELKQA